jgi:hypothetical protein
MFLAESIVRAYLAHQNFLIDSTHIYMQPYDVSELAQVRMEVHTSRVAENGTKLRNPAS